MPDNEIRDFLDKMEGHFFCLDFETQRMSSGGATEYREMKDDLRKFIKKLRESII